MQRSFRSPALMMAAMMLGLAACAPKRAQAPAPRVPGTTQPARPSPSLSAAEFVGKAGSIDLFIIKASELAATRASALRYREVAGRLIGSHRGTSQQLSFAGRRLDVLPSAELRPEDQARLDRVSAAADFQTAYRREITAAIREQLAIARAFAASGSSPTLRPVAEMIAKADEADLRLLGYL